MQRVRQEELGIDPGSVTDLKDNGELAEHGINILRSTLSSFMKKEYPRLPSLGVE